MRATKKRSIVKAISWRIIGTGLTAMLFWIFTGEAVNILVQFGIVDTVVKLITFYTHERMWNKSKWGLTDEKE